jgi:hypothetical protein
MMFPGGVRVSEHRGLASHSQAFVVKERRLRAAQSSAGGGILKTFTPPCSNERYRITDSTDSQDSENP